MVVIQFQAPPLLQYRIRFSCHSPSPPPPTFPTIHQFHPKSFPITLNKIGLTKNAKSTLTVCSTSASAQAQQQEFHIVRDRSVSVVLLAGGKGKRMGASMPKQYLPLLGQPIALYSFYTFSHMVEVKEIIVVCDPSYEDIFEDVKGNDQVELKFALPGKERQDSVYSGLQAVDSNSELVCIHDSARPLVLSGDVKKVLKDGLLNGAAVLGVPVKATIKEANNESFVVRTLDRKTLWEMQTPQVIKPELLRKGFELVNREGLEVTDDVSIVEHLKQPVYITEGSYTNIKCISNDVFGRRWRWFCRFHFLFLCTTVRPQHLRLPRLNTWTSSLPLTALLTTTPTVTRPRPSLVHKLALLLDLTITNKLPFSDKTAPPRSLIHALRPEKASPL